MSHEQTTTPDEQNAQAEAPAEQLQPDGAGMEAAQDTVEAMQDTQTQDAQALSEQLAALQTQANEYMEGWQRARAEFANYKKRVEREMSESVQSGTFEVLTNLLPIIDDFERAMANVPPDLQGHAWINGIELIQRNFNKLLDKYEVTAVDPVGKLFDPNLHQAVGTDDDGAVESGHVSTTLQKGYISGDKVLRPALVRVAQ